MPDNDLAHGNGQEPASASSPDSRNGQEPAASQVSTSSGGHGSGSAHSSNGDPDANLTPDDWKSIALSARAEASRRRVEEKELADLRAYKQQQEDAKLSQEQRRDKELAAAQERAAAAELKAQQTAIRAEVKSVAATLGLNTALALRLLDHAALEFNDDGDPSNVADLLAHAVEEYGLGAVAPGALNGKAADLVAPARPQPTSIGATPANPARADGIAIGGWSWDLIGKLTKEQAEALTPAQKRAMSDFIRSNYRQ